jgi:hypothetical protein
MSPAAIGGSLSVLNGEQWLRGEEAGMGAMDALLAKANACASAARRLRAPPSAAPQALVHGDARGEGDALGLFLHGAARAARRATLARRALGLEGLRAQRVNQRVGKLADVGNGRARHQLRQRALQRVLRRGARRAVAVLRRRRERRVRVAARRAQLGARQTEVRVVAASLATTAGARRSRISSFSPAAAAGAPASSTTSMALMAVAVAEKLGIIPSCCVVVERVVRCSRIRVRARLAGDSW